VPPKESSEFVSIHSTEKIQHSNAYLECNYKEKMKNLKQMNLRYRDYTIRVELLLHLHSAFPSPSSHDIEREELQSMHP